MQNVLRVMATHKVAQLWHNSRAAVMFLFAVPALCIG